MNLFYDLWTLRQTPGSGSPEKTGSSTLVKSDSLHAQQWTLVYNNTNLCIFVDLPSEAAPAAVVVHLLVQKPEGHAHDRLRGVGDLHVAFIPSEGGDVDVDK